MSLDVDFANEIFGKPAGNDAVQLTRLAWLADTGFTPLPEEDGEEVAGEEVLLDWDDYAGQARLKTRLKVHMVGAMEREDALHPMMFYGPPGSGKTTIARMMAKEMNVPLEAITRPVSAAGLRKKLTEIAADSLLLIDECHQLPSRTQHVLMQLTEDKSVDMDWGLQKFPHLNIVLATTDIEKMDDALKSRCQIIEWDNYPDDDMTEIVEGFALRYGVDLTNDDCEVLGVASGGVPRRARSFVSDALDMQTTGLEVTADTILSFCDCTRSGLTKAHLNYLEALGTMGGRAGLSALCTKLRANTSAVKETERLLLDKHFVEFGQRGRVITLEGRKEVGL